MDLGLAGKRALVMGGTAGLGYAIAEVLRSEGADVAICARDTQRLRDAAEKLGVHPFAADLPVNGAAAELVRTVRSKIGGLDILIVNTGGPPARSFETASDEEWREAFDGLWMSAVGAIREALATMSQQRWGRVLVVTSIAAREPLQNMVLSNGLRPGLHGLINSLSREYASKGITFNALMPGWTKTERVLKVGLDEAAIVSQIPAGRMAEPVELGALAAFLASHHASYVTGQAIACDGGAIHSI